MGRRKERGGTHRGREGRRETRKGEIGEEGLCWENGQGDTDQLFVQSFSHVDNLELLKSDKFVFLHHFFL